MKALVEEIDKKTYNPDIYFTSLDPQARRYTSKKINKQGTISTSRPVKRINYSLADLEARLYTSRSEGDGNSISRQDDRNSKNSHSFEERYTQQEILQSDRRFMELNTENFSDLPNVPTLLSDLTGVPRDRIESTTKPISQTSDGLSALMGGSSFVKEHSKYGHGWVLKPETLREIQLSYKSTKLPKPKRKNTNRIVALKKVLSSKRNLHSFLDSALLNLMDKNVIYHNVYNKRYFKVLPLITTCSICGGYDSISSCVNCGNKICSVSCFKLHNETRCRNR
ncbi:ADI_G0046220.mRNA.1.CDS.1 [Saccharomyces cerevisiae]|jgi:zinc finger HIT domain-containing protein 1|uniref:Vacuolar protein sorting-associated protein 71 n=8 Tax=Saccharomyces TaxID=4930 RepID=VPS71_YEAST|eukprot:NP_013671.1 Vps71p [Saccharomyces cerevisiae S288C]